MSPSRGQNAHVKSYQSKASLIFDLDGTLIDSCPGIGASLSAAFRSVGRVMPEVDLRAIVGPPIRTIATRVEPTLTESELLEIERTYRAAYDVDGWRETILFDGVVETLGTLRGKGFDILLVTNKPRIPTEKIMSRFGLTDLFEEIVTRDSRAPIYHNKSEMLSEMLKRRSLKPELTTMVGDTLEDSDAAVSNGLRFFYAVYGYGSIASPQYPITTVAGILSLVSE